ncbi:hypothetical protein HS088_TW23G00902 [Tripterygium wilfordii]|uniref:Uncharacterized protein n=1 Tax=Tripterygium wilfordii TaxID=458696 RepID=A0A7J7BWA9_TRIWF|nr:hypothetical protein HS088_TW23G00902 [Tripterygium wilfordii]
MEETSESPANVFGDEISVYLSDFLTDSDDEGEVSIREEMIEKLMQELYKEISHSKSPPVTITSTTEKHLIPSSSAQLVVDNGKSESCGASLSGTASIMAGFEFVGPAGWKEGDMGLGSVEGKMEGCDGVETSDEWLTRVLSWGPLEMEDWT